MFIWDEWIDQITDWCFHIDFFWTFELDSPRFNTWVELVYRGTMKWVEKIQNGGRRPPMAVEYRRWQRFIGVPLLLSDFGWVLTDFVGGAVGGAPVGDWCISVLIVIVQTWWLAAKWEVLFPTIRLPKSVASTSIDDERLVQHSSRTK